MTKPLRIVLWVVAATVVALVVLGGFGAFFVLRNLRVTTPTGTEAFAQIDALRGRFPARTPLVEIEDVRRGRVRVNHPPRTAPLQHLNGFEILVWKADDQELVHTRAPLWMMRFSTLSLLSNLGLAPGSMSITVDDVERYGPGVVIDMTTPKGDRVLVVAQ